MDAMRAMLDELMGKERDVPLQARSNKRVTYDDPAVCKWQLAGLCPYKLFKNTKSDMGNCEYEYHEESKEWPNIVADYERTDEREKERYERRLAKFLEDLIREMDRKIAKNKERAAAESLPRELKPDDAIRVQEMQSRAKELLERSQALGEQGDVDASMMLAQQAEAVKQQVEKLVKTLTAPERTMEVCDICGVFINSTDNELRRQEHLTGKQYLGWKAIREKLKALQEKFENPPAAARERSEPRDVRREEPRRERERERSPARPVPDRRDGRGYERDHRADPREYGRERERDYRRERDAGDHGRGYERGYGGRDDRPRDDRPRDDRRRGSEVAPPGELYRRGGSSRGYGGGYQDDRGRRY